MVNNRMVLKNPLIDEMAKEPKRFFDSILTKRARKTINVWFFFILDFRCSMNGSVFAWVAFSFRFRFSPRWATHNNQKVLARVLEEIKTGRGEKKSKRFFFTFLQGNGKRIECQGFLIERGNKLWVKNDEHPMDAHLNGYWFNVSYRKLFLRSIILTWDFFFDRKWWNPKTEDFNDGTWSKRNKPIDTFINP